MQGAILAGWPTCKSSDADKGARTAEGAEAEFERKGTGADLPTLASAVSPEATALLAPLGGWGTPTSQDSRHASFSASQQQRDPACLTNQVYMVDLAGWGTPTSQTFGDTPETHLARKQRAIDSGSSMGLVVSTLLAQVHLASGTTVSPSSAETGKPAASRGSLNPAFSLWLMSYPMAWMACGMLASLAMTASRSRRGKSKGESCS